MDDASCFKVHTSGTCNHQLGTGLPSSIEQEVEMKEDGEKEDEENNEIKEEQQETSCHKHKENPRILRMIIIIGLLYRNKTLTTLVKFKSGTRL